jgi:SAM-dependent methyltransferase
VVGGRLRAGLRRLARASVPPRSHRADERARRIEAYLAGGRVPWSEGYKPYRADLLRRVVRDEALLATFRAGRPLPPGFGVGIDERVVEYPWVVSRLPAGPGRLLDAGSALNHAYLLDHPRLAEKSVVIVTLAPEHLERRPNVSYLFGDLRDLILRDGAFETVVCISTLEHVGLDNARLYGAGERYREDRAEDWRAALRELRRVLAPGGRLLLTVPFGRAERFEWMQQFDAAGLERIVETVGAEPARTFFRHTPSGWAISDAADCADCAYFDVHSASEPAPDGAAAARAVACLDFELPGR